MKHARDVFGKTSVTENAEGVGRTSLPVEPQVQERREGEGGGVSGSITV